MTLIDTGSSLKNLIQKCINPLSDFHYIDARSVNLNASGAHFENVAFHHAFLYNRAINRNLLRAGDNPQLLSG
ncbi:hypothetical protein [Bradyrhizobium sp. CCBAU 51753]|uniref:hypothetical protein n=1 Tax=Bradyrhizobium sp. CCBAU 51753 TaxID=1325100 RepID=UPI00188BFF0A|nr:hypothetical protein [Bradyrhizobium sp. CCBAU 51753]